MAGEERVSNSGLQKQISDLGLQLRSDIGEIKAMLKSIEDRVRTLETNEAGSHPLIESRIDLAFREIEQTKTRITVMEKMVGRLDHANRLLTWIGGLLGSAVLTWLIAQILAVIP